MADSEECIGFVIDQLAGFRVVVPRRMFGCGALVVGTAPRVANGTAGRHDYGRTGDQRNRRGGRNGPSLPTAELWTSFITA